MSGITVECYTWSATHRMTIDYSFNSYDKIGLNMRIANNSQVSGFTDEHIEYTNGRLQCQWEVASGGLVKYNGRGYDFVHQKYYVMLAKGKMESGKLDFSEVGIDNLIFMLRNPNGSTSSRLRSLGKPDRLNKSSKNQQWRHTDGH